MIQIKVKKLNKIQKKFLIDSSGILFLEDENIDFRENLILKKLPKIYLNIIVE